MKNKSKIDEIKKHLIENEETISVAESVTAGFLQLSLSSVTEAACYFQGGITTYNIGQKCRLLNVEPIYALPVNCVSERVANEMALNVIKLFNSNYGIGVTGFAQKDKKMGVDSLFAFFSIAESTNVLLVKKITSGETQPEKVKMDYVNQVILAFHKLLFNGM